MFAWRPYARPIAVRLWATFVNDMPFDRWEFEWERSLAESPMDFIVEDKRARFLVRDQFERVLSLRDLDLLAKAGADASGYPVEWLRLDNSRPDVDIVTITFEISRLRVTAKGFKEVSA